MAADPNEMTMRAGRNVRLDTLVRLRWLAVIGQTTAVLVVYVGLDFELPIWACLAVIALAAWLNVALRVRFRLSQRLEPDRAAWLLAFDIAELAILLFLTGGLQNPFSVLLLGPVLLSATALPPRMTVTLGAFAAACATVLIFYHYDLPWDSDEPLELPAIYNMGVWLSLLLALGFIGVCGWDWSSVKSQKGDWLRDKKLNVLVQVSLEPEAELTKLGVPSIWKYVSEENRQVAELVISQQVFQRSYVAPPGTRDEEIAILRKAFDETMVDPQFLADAEKVKISITPLPGAKVQSLIEKLYATPKEVVERAKAMIKP